ncbi:ABC-F family ATP-binding cassette domain-containing protein [Persicirhabdus sediminis]|uniref:ABC-F family ATP-binding cassette domain-containing protein n=2 Tax=Persicirhabdus sediminis TaxID=454144 RepID=A0A8J7MFL5_9BACT|nr:ABC-F family ATP-binding cassette domain-containing protein [Persicirhabdus sediminis]
MLSVQNLRVEFGPRVLFKDLSFTVLEKERIAFAGHNGAGKSTLMKCVAGIIEQSAGNIVKPKHCQVGYLPQEGIHISGITLWDETEGAFAEAKEMQKQIDELSESLYELDPRSAPYSDCLDKIGELELQMDHFDIGRIKPRIESVLTGLGFKRSDFERDCSEFSGGWQMRIALAKLLLQQPDVLLLDEPTNHLDITSQRWMEQYLINYPGAILIISHDLSLLDVLTTRTIAFHHGRAEEYAGNYSFYMKESVLRKEILAKQYKAQQREIEKAEQFINRFRATASKATLVQSKIKQLAKIERIELEEEDSVMNFKFPEPPLSGHMVAQLEKVDKSYGKLEIFNGFDFEVCRGEHIAIVGPNGAGKSTFCRMITGQEEPDAGVHQLGHKVAASFFSQNHADELDPDKTVEETVAEVASRENAPFVRNLLGCFLFRGDDVFKRVGVLSGGERSRVALVRMLVRPANFLILDEPTNHLDVQSQEVLQNALKDYPGAVLIVSHNRAFLDPICNKTLEFSPGREPRWYPGNVSYYIEKLELEMAQAKAAAAGGTTQPVAQLSGITAKAKAEKTATAANTGSRKEQRRLEAEKRQKRNKVLKPLQSELESVEASIAEFEAAQAKLTEHMSSPQVANDSDKMMEATHAYQNLSEKLENAFSSWGELSDKIEQLEAELD